MRIAIAAAATMAVLALPGQVRAQSSRPATLPPVEHQQALTTNPVGMALEWFTGEYERRAGASATWGVVGSSWNLVGDYRSLRLLARYYPQEAALSGFYVGVQGGVHHLDDDTRPGFGVELGENWLLGRNRRFSLGTGFGLVRVFGGRSGDIVLPVLRLNVGIAF